MENNAVARLINQRHLILAQQRQLGADPTKQARSEAATQRRLALDKGIWRITTWNLYKTWAEENKVPLYPISAPIFALWFFDLGRPVSVAYASNTISHIEQIRLSIEEAEIWTSAPEEKLGKDPVVKAIKLGFRGDGEPPSYKAQRSASSSSPEASDDGRPGRSSRDSSVELPPRKRRRTFRAPPRVFLRRNGTTWPEDAIDPQFKVRVGRPPPLPTALPWTESPLEQVPDSDDDTYRPAKILKKSLISRVSDSPETDVPTKALHSLMASPSTSSRIDPAKEFTLRQEMTATRDELASVRSLLALLVGRTDHQETPPTTSLSHIAVHDLAPELARLRTSLVAGNALLSKAKASKRSLITAQREELTRLRAGGPVGESEPTAKKLKTVKSMSVEELMRATARLTKKLATARRHAERASEQFVVKTEVVPEAMDVDVPAEKAGPLEAKRWTGDATYTTWKGKSIEVIVLDSD
ncbi:hypothetical protein RQP46_005560 [Phenoliferia psychrophenolica]